MCSQRRQRGLRIQAAQRHRCRDSDARIGIGEARQGVVQSIVGSTCREGPKSERSGLGIRVRESGPKSVQDRVVGGVIALKGDKKITDRRNGTLANDGGRVR